MPMSFLNLVEAYKVGDASTAALYGSEGRRVRGRQMSQSDQKRMVEALRFVTALQRGDISQDRFREAMTTSDFPSLFGAIMDRQLLGRYRAVAPVWQKYVKRETVRDFRTVQRYVLDGLTGKLTIVHEQEEYPEGSLSDSDYSYKVAKYGKRTPISWEAMVNDDMGAFSDIPTALGNSARATEDWFATSLYVGATGPKPALFTATNTVTGNPDLTSASLQQAIIQQSAFADSEGEPIIVDSGVLVVPPALQFAAAAILGAERIETTVGDTKIISGNFLSGRFEVVVNPYLPLIDKSANANSTWYLFNKPDSGRPALTMGFLRGHEEPEIFMKASNAIKLGTNTQNPMDGDFDTDTVEYKVRHVLGGTAANTLSMMVSTGAA